MTIKCALAKLIPMSSPIPPKQAIEEIVHWIKTYYDDRKGGLPRSVKQDGSTSKYRLFNDLGDYLPFMAYLGEKKFCDRHLQDVKNILTKDHLLPPDFKYFGLPCTRSYEHTDLLLGLIDAYTFFPSEDLKALLSTVSQGVIQAFHPDGKNPSSWYFPTIKYHLPILDYKDGMFIEIWTLLAEAIDEPRYLKKAEDLASKLIKAVPKPFAPLVPDVVGMNPIGHLVTHTYLNKHRLHYTPMKYLSNTAYAILEIYKATRKDIYLNLLKEIKTALQTYALDENHRIVEFDRNGTKAIQSKTAHLVQNFPIMDWAADCFYFTKDESFLTFAKQIADAWLPLQEAQTGLIPFSTKSQETDLDTLTDTSMAFMKIGELSGDQKYSEAGKRIINGILTYHRKPELKGYVLMVNAKTGEVTCNDLKIKFICLFLKAIIVLDEQKPIYGTSLYELTKDR